jgi:hypothetical protein
VLIRPSDFDLDCPAAILLCLDTAVSSNTVWSQEPQAVGITAACALGVCRYAHTHMLHTAHSANGFSMPTGYGQSRTAAVYARQLRRRGPQAWARTPTTQPCGPCAQATRPAAALHSKLLHSQVCARHEAPSLPVSASVPVHVCGGFSTRGRQGRHILRVRHNAC